MSTSPFSTGRSTIPPERARNFVVFSVGQGVSAVGTWMQKTAMGWLAWELTHSVAWVGTVALADFIAALWVAPLAGAVTDRSNPYRIIWTTQILLLLVAVAACALSAVHLLDIRALLAIALVDATLQGFNQPVRMTITGLLAGRARMSQGLATHSIAFNLARSIGPALAGLIMVTGRIELVFLANAVSFVAMLAVIFYVRPWIDRPWHSARTPLGSDIVEGYRYVVKTPQIATFFFLTALFSLLARPFSELLPAFAGSVFDGGPQILAGLMSAQGIGALLGALWMLRRRDEERLVDIMLLSGVGLAAALLCFSSTQDFRFALVAMVAAGLCHVTCNISMQSMAQLLSDPAFRGRVLALYGLMFRAGPALGAFAIGFASHWVGLQWLVGGAAAIYGGMLIYYMPAARRVYAVVPSHAD